MNVAAMRYEQCPTLHSIFSFGSEVLVPCRDINRLSFYLKCCVVGCGITRLPVNSQLLDYMHAHLLPIQLQQSIIQLAFTELHLELLFNRVFILDEQNVLLRPGTMNAFFEFKTASNYFAIMNLGIIEDQRTHTHHVMLCSINWLREYYLDPFFRYQEMCPILQNQRGWISLDSALLCRTHMPTIPCASSSTASDTLSSGYDSQCQCQFCVFSDVYEAPGDGEMVINDYCSAPDNIPMTIAIPIENFREQENRNFVAAKAKII